MLRNEERDDPEGRMDGQERRRRPSSHARRGPVRDDPHTLPGQPVTRPGDEDIDAGPDLSLPDHGVSRLSARNEEKHRGAQNCADMATAGMKCPQCGSRHVVSNITIRWNQVKGSFLSERGHFCFQCGRPFQHMLIGHFTFRSLRVPVATAAMHSLQASGDVVVIRYRNGATEILF